MTTPAPAPARSAATRCLLRLSLAAAFLGLAFPALAQQAAVSGIGLDKVSAAANAAHDVSALAMDDAVPANPVALAPTPKIDVPAKPDNKVQALLKRALALLGTPYRWGGTGTNGFDCSGLVGYVFKSALGVELPRVSTEMAEAGQRIDRGSLTAGDIVFFGVHGRRVDHVGIYVGNGQFLHAPRTGRDVTVSRLDEGYWSGKFLQARRIAGI